MVRFKLWRRYEKVEQLAACDRDVTRGHVASTHRPSASGAGLLAQVCKLEAGNSS